MEWGDPGGKNVSGHIGIVACSAYAQGKRVADVPLEEAGDWAQRPGHLMWIGLYEPDGDIRHVGHTAGFTAKFSRELLDVVRPLETGEHAEPGADPAEPEPPGKERNRSERLDLFLSWTPLDRITLTVDLPWAFNRITEIVRHTVAGTPLISAVRSGV